MPYVLFHDHLPVIAERETRTVVIMPNSNCGLPPGEYAFLEMFCDEPGCDCRRVFFYVVSSISKKLEAVLTYGWESPAFYTKWLRHDDSNDIVQLKGPSLNVGSPQSHLAPLILDLFRIVLLPDTSYIERVKAHYLLFREEIDKKHKRRRDEYRKHNQRDSE